MINYQSIMEYISFVSFQDHNTIDVMYKYKEISKY